MVAQARVTNKDKQKTEKKVGSSNRPPNISKQMSIQSAEGVISLLHTAATTAEKILFSVSYLIHKVCLMVLILCIKIKKISCSCFSITHLVIVLQLQNYLEDL